jgi:hypothetical protein
VGSDGAEVQFRKKREMMYKRTKTEASAKKRMGLAIAIDAEKTAGSKG